MLFRSRLDEQGEPKCVLRSYSREDTAFNDRACEAALAGQFDFTGANADKSAWFFFFEQDGRLAVLLPLSTDPRKGPPIPEAMAAARAGLTPESVERLRFDFWVDLNGRIVDCTIKVSSEDDAQDILGCDLLQRLGRFERSFDPFGRALPQQQFDWSLSLERSSR